MRLMGRKFTYRAGLIAAGAALAIAAPLTVGQAGAAPPAPTSPTPESLTTVRALDVTQQTPSVGISRSGAAITGAFVAPLAAAATGTDTTIVWLEPMPRNACATSLRDARVAVTWKNTSTGRTDDATFPACTAGAPTLSPALPTGSGTIEFTTSVLGKGGDTFTLAPGTATVAR